MSIEAAPEERGSNPATPARVFLVVAIVLFLLKLLLVSQREMVPEQHDAEAYASASLYDLRLLFIDSAGHPPGAPLVMALARSLGIPYRVFTEVFLAATAFLFFRPLVVSMRLALAAVAILYAVLLFHPTLILEMDRSMSDSVGFSLWLAGAGGIIGFVAAPREKVHYWSLGLAIASFAFAGITRSGEGPIVIVEMVAVALSSLLLFRGLDSWRRQRAVVACFCAVIANLAATQALSAAHYVNNGYWGASPVESREWWQLYSALLSLPVQRTDRRVLINTATMEKADSFSQDLRNMDPCVKQSSTVQLPNESVAWIITGCLPGEESPERYGRMRTISADIIKGAHENHLELSAPVLGVIPRPIGQWLPDLPSSILGTALAVVEIPDSTRVAQSSWQEQLFNQALLRRTALVVTGENPEIFGYNPFIRILYVVLAALFWPLILLAVVVVIRFPRAATKSSLIAFALAVALIDVLCRISFYSIVDWIVWDVPPRYLLGVSVLTVVIVSMLLMVWLGPAAGRTLRPKLVKLPGLPAWAENLGYRSRRA